MNLRNAISVFLFFVFCFSCCSGQEESADLKVLFSGYLLGYYRVPDKQPADFLKDCTVEKSPSWENIGDLSPALSQLVGLHEPPFQSHRDPNTILVGMGGNFGVELYSRTYVETTPSGAKILHPKSRNPLDPNWKSVGLSDAIGDNVGCFLSLAGYNAIVPGKEDFYFGAQRVQMIAERLAVANDENCQGVCRHPVKMLAANLITQTGYTTEPTKIPDSAQKLHFVPGLPPGIELAEVSDGGKVLPFLRAFTARKVIEPIPKLYLCAGGPNNRSEDVFPCDNHVPLLCLQNSPGKPPSGCENTTPDDGANDEQGRNTETNKRKEYKYSLPKDFYLIGDTNYNLCTDTQGEHRCIRFRVSKSYLGESCSIATTEERCSPYVYIHPTPDRPGTVIYGVVDPNIEELVGRDNLSWKNIHSGLKTEVTALDPLKSLLQAEQFFQEKHGNDPTPRKVLLAEMSRGNAEELAENLDFDVVIASARPYKHATNNRTLELEPEPEKLKLEQQERMNRTVYRGVVVVPWQGFCRSSDSKDCPLDPQYGTVFNPIRTLVLNDAGRGCLPNGQGCRRITLSGEPAKVFKEDWTPKADLDVAARIRLHWPEPANKQDDAFINETLYALRSGTHTDAAMLQRRDFYFGPFRSEGPAKDNLGIAIERVLWSGNILQTITVTGATLQKVMKESDAFDKQDIQSAQENLQTGRGLYTLGITRTKDDQLFISGDLVDPKRLYTIATSNHITAGDTGYPELNDPELADKNLPKPPEAGGPDGMRISEIVCREISPGNCVTDAPAHYQQNEGDSLFAASADPADNPRASLRARVDAWFSPAIDKPLLATKTTIPSPLSELQASVQNRAGWRLSLVQASFSFQESSNNLSEKERALLFTGFSAPGLNGANAHKWQMSKRAELVHSGRYFDEYWRNQLDYSSQVTEQIAPAVPSVSRDKNRDQFDLGFYYHPFTACHFVLPCPAPQKEYPRWGFVLEPFRFDSPLAKEELVIGPKTNQEKVNLGRAQNYFGRSGLRMETPSSHFEFGLEGGWERGALVAFQAGTTFCVPLPTESPEGCLMNLTPPIDVTQIRDVRERRGFYIDHAWTTPIPFHKWQSITQTQGEWFPFGPSDDNASDTRRIIDVSEKLSIPIFASLSFQPGGEYFYYRNKFGITHLGRWTPSASLTWSFDKYSGGGWKKSLNHSKSTTNGAGS